MKIKDLTKEELENMSYDDIAYMLLSESKKTIKLIDLFNKIGELTGLSSNTIEEKIGDFFEMLTMDKRFIMLDDGSWDLSSRHAKKVIIDDDEEETIVEEEPSEEEVEEEKVEDIFYDEQEDDDTMDDEFADLVVIDEEEEEQNA